MKFTYFLCNLARMGRNTSVINYLFTVQDSYHVTCIVVTMVISFVGTVLYKLSLLGSYRN